MNENMFNDIRDADERQEAWALFLEGSSEADARQGARSANDKVNSKRVSGPITNGDGNGHGDRPLISDLEGIQWNTAKSVGIDRRSEYEREVDWLTQDHAAEAVAELRFVLTDRQWEVMAHKYGLDGLTPCESHAELADRLGMSTGSASKYVNKIRASVAVKAPNFLAYLT